MDEKNLEDDGSYIGYYFCHNGVLWNKCGGDYNGRQVYGSEYDPQTQFCSSDDPGDDSYIYDVRTHFCDARQLAKGRTYGYKKLIVTNADGDSVYSKTWMTENVDYDIASKSRCLPDDKECSNGRFYTWSSAKASCPDGWTLPDKGDYSDLISAFGSDSWVYSEYGFSGFSAQKLGYIEVKEDRLVVQSSNAAYFWTATGSTVEADDGYYFSVDANANMNDDSHMSKNYFLNVRCIKND